MSQETLYWDEVVVQDRAFRLAASVKGVCCIGLPPRQSADREAEWQQDLQRLVPGSEALRAPERVAPYMRELDEYFRGGRTSFAMPLDLRGTPFQLAVWRALLAIPYGHVCSYGDIAAVICRPRAVRAVGTANGANPVPIVVPCHRVIGKDGTLTGYGGGLPLKEWLLAIEGVHVRESARASARR